MEEIETYLTNKSSLVVVATPIEKDAQNKLPIGSM